MGRPETGPIPPYGVPIQEAIASGDLAKMRRQADEAERWLRQTGDVSAALERLKIEIAKLERSGR